MLVNNISTKVTKPIDSPRQIKTSRLNFQDNSKTFSIINLEPITAKKIAIIITDIKMIINSINEEKIISFLENPKILKTKF